MYLCMYYWMFDKCSTTIVLLATPKTLRQKTVKQSKITNKKKHTNIDNIKTIKHQSKILVTLSRISSIKSLCTHFLPIKTPICSFLFFFSSFLFFSFLRFFLLFSVSNWTLQSICASIFPTKWKSLLSNQSKHTKIWSLLFKIAHFITFFLSSFSQP